MQDDQLLTANPSTKDSQKVLESFFRRKLAISPQLSTRAIVAELNRGAENGPELLMEESKQNYADVGERYKVIDSNTVLVIADKDLKDRIRLGQSDWREIQRKGIPMHWNRVQKLKLSELFEGVYDWNLRYDSFLGVMAGVLDDLRSQNGFLNM